MRITFYFTITTAALSQLTLCILCVNALWATPILSTEIYIRACSISPKHSIYTLIVPNNRVNSEGFAATVMLDRLNPFAGPTRNRMGYE